MWRMARMDEWTPVIAMLVFNLTSAVMTALVKMALQQGINTLVLITLRQLVATAFLAPIAYFKERNARPKFTLKIFVYHFFSALLGATLPQYSFFYGLKLTTATFSITFANLSPVVTFLIAIALRVESLNVKSKAGASKIVGTLMSLAGAMLLSLYKGVAVGSGSGHHPDHFSQGNDGDDIKNWAFGTIALLANCLCFSLWLLLQSRLTKKYPALYSSTAIMFFISTVQSGALTATTERHASVWIVKRKLEIVTILYSGIMASGAGYLIMTWCVQKRGPVFTAAFTPIIQIMVAIIDFCFLHEPIYLGSIPGSLLMIFGLYLLLWGKKKEASVCCPNINDPTTNKQVDEEEGVSKEIFTN